MKTVKSLTIIDAMNDPALFKSWFKGKSWGNWRVFLKALFGLKLGKTDLETLQRFTGREKPPASVSEGWLVVGRRGGKSLIAALTAVFLACFKDYSKHLAPGEVGTVMVIAADRKQARVILRYVSGFLDGVPMLSAMVANKTKESIELNNRIVIEVHTASYRTTRGYSIIAALLDEVAFWRSEESANPDTEILNALRPGMATVPGSLLLALSSPYARRGELWKAYKNYFGKDGEILVWQGETRDMNPTVPESVIQKALEEDESAARAEWLAEFRRDIESFVNSEAVEAVVLPDRRELPPLESIRYFGFCDPSGGSQDSMTLGIAHRENGKLALDCVRERVPPFSPKQVVSEFCELLKRYRISTIHGDRYAGQWPREQFRSHGVEYRTSEKTKSEIYIAFLPLLNSEQIELLHHKRLISQLCNLERRTSRSGKDSIDHGPGGRDDVINAAAGALVLANQQQGGYDPARLSIPLAPYVPAWKVHNAPDWTLGGGD
ncbi:hypothetical protein MYX84_00770 [Acidobacteria bacterium AH-259-O06]|nr:hypothetical protein [Acidobacteria bacterium AH-259-O06]